MARSLSDLIGKIIRVLGFDYEGVGRIEFAQGDVTVTPTLSQGRSGEPTTLTLTFGTNSPTNPEGDVENQIPAWDVEGNLVRSGLFVNPEYADDTFLPGLDGTYFNFGGAESETLFTSPWARVEKRQDTSTPHVVYAIGGDTDDLYEGEYQELVRSLNYVANAGIDESYAYDETLVMLRNVSQVATIPESSRVYVFDVLLDLKLALGVKALARVEFCAWNDGGVTYVSDPVLYEIAGQSEAYAWSTATLTTLVVEDIPRLRIELDLSGVSGTYPSTSLRVSIKHSHTRRPE